MKTGWWEAITEVTEKKEEGCAYVQNLPLPFQCIQMAPFQKGKVPFILRSLSWEGGLTSQMRHTSTTYLWKGSRGVLRYPLSPDTQSGLPPLPKHECILFLWKRKGSQVFWGRCCWSHLIFSLPLDCWLCYGLRRREVTGVSSGNRLPLTLGPNEYVGFPSKCPAKCFQSCIWISSAAAAFWNGG